MEFSHVHTCPACHGEIEIAGELHGQSVVCPHCGRLVLPQVQSEQDLSYRQELDAVHIRQVSQAKRATMRAASYAVAGAIACVVLAIEMLWRAALSYRAGEGWLRPILYVLGYDVFGLAGLWLWSKNRALARQGRQSQVAAPLTSPDFSTLGDGSQVVKNLEQMNSTSGDD